MEENVCMYGYKIKHNLFLKTNTIAAIKDPRNLSEISDRETIFF